MSAPSVTWYVNRLRRMSPSEVVSRAGDSSRRLAWTKRQVHVGDVPPVPPDAASNRRFSATLPAGLAEQVDADAAACLIKAADGVLAGQWLVLGNTRTDSAAPDWFFDPVTGRTAPAETYAFKVHHRDENETGNIKQVWEMSRHHHLTVLAAAYWLTGDERYAVTVDRQLRDWWVKNPFLSGVHWTSAIEIGVRLISWVWVRRLLADWPGVHALYEENDDAIRQIAWHQEYLAAFPSRGSSANNHVIAEAAGQLAAACAFDWYERSAQWRQDATALLEKEFALNTFASGLNRELATDYHRFVLDLVLLAAAEADAAGTPLSPGTWHRLTLMTDAAAAIRDVGGNPPRQGDGDNGQALVVDGHEVHEWDRTLSGAVAVLGRPDWCPPIVASVQGALVGAIATHRQGEHLTYRPAVFRDAGMALLRSNPQDGPELWCRFDAGPHGFLSIAAHAHADALSMELRHDGDELLIDPGTYCYHGEPSWRAWFRSTAAHNTIELGGVDQSSSGGPFMWDRHAVSRLIETRVDADGLLTNVTGEHEGYLALDRPTLHRRRVDMDSAGRRVLVTDTLREGAVPASSVASPTSAAASDKSGQSAAVGPLGVRMFWHLAPGVSVDLSGSVATLSWLHSGQERTARMELPSELEWSLLQAAEQPVQAWYSPGFGERVATRTLVGRASDLPAEPVTTVIDLDHH